MVVKSSFDPLSGPLSGMSRFAQMRTRLMRLPRRWWVIFFVISVIAHIIGIGVMLVILFGGARGGGTARDTVIMSVGEPADEDIDLQLDAPPVPNDLREAEDDLDLSELLEVPLDTDFNDMAMDNAAMAMIAPALPTPSAAVIQQAMPGGGLISGGPQSFADYIEHLQNTGIDVVFAIDATGSMVWVHKQVLQRMAQLAGYVRNLVPLARFGIVAYRDYADPEFVVRVSQPSFDIQKAEHFMAGIDALGGGDIPEAVVEAMRVSEQKIAWRPGAQRVVIIIGDAPPHLHEMTEAEQIATRMKRRGVRLSLLDSRVEANREMLGRTRTGGAALDLREQRAMAEFRRLARLGGGMAATLSAERQLMKTLALLIFDDRFHDELAPFLANLE